MSSEAARDCGLPVTRPPTVSVSIWRNVMAPRPFTAAHVYLYNPEKRVTYMVYTRAGTYQAINLYPGEYEVRAARRGEAIAPDPGPNPTHAARVALQSPG